jgi:hypothetical protein
MHVYKYIDQYSYKTTPPKANNNNNNNDDDNNKVINSTSNTTRSRPSSALNDRRKSSSGLTSPNTVVDGVSSTTPRTDVSLDGKNAPETANR